MINQEMQKFLVVSVFGSVLQKNGEKTIIVDNDECLKKNCIKRAYLDLARVIPYKYC